MGWADSLSPAQPNTVDMLMSIEDGDEFQFWLPVLLYWLVAEGLPWLERKRPEPG